jgi:hypothetical protein
MKLIWSKEISNDSFDYYKYCCKPIVYKDKFFYAYSKLDRNNINDKGLYETIIFIKEYELNTVNLSEKSISFISNEIYKSKLIRTSQWKFEIINDQLFLYVGFWLELKNESLEISNIDKICKEWSVQNNFKLKDKYLKYNLLSTFECFNQIDNILLWKLKIKGYLYTDILLKENNFYFGTAGKGGAFYCVELESGIKLTEFSNSDSSQFTWHQNTVYLKDIKNNLIQIQANNGKILNYLKLKDKLFYAPILIDKNYLYTTVFDKKKEVGKIICIEID